MRRENDFRKILGKANDNLLSESYYHGIVDLADVDKLLVRDGDFLFGIPEEDEEEVIISISISGNTFCWKIFENQLFLQSIVWVVRYNRDLWAFNIGINEKKEYFVNKKSFKNVSEMVSNYVRTRESIHEEMPIVVKRPVPHPVSCVVHFRKMVALEFCNAK